MKRMSNRWYLAPGQYQAIRITAEAPNTIHIVEWLPGQEAAIYHASSRAIAAQGIRMLRRIERKVRAEIKVRHATL